MASDSEPTLIKVCDRTQLQEGEIFHAEIAGSGNFAIYLVQDQVYATDDTCSHGAASLAEDGYLDGFKVTCSWHDGVFDIRTGEPLALPCVDPIKSYPVVVRDGAVHVVL